MTGTGKTEEDEFREIYNMRNYSSIQLTVQLLTIWWPLHNSLDATFRAVVQDVKRR